MMTTLDHLIIRVNDLQATADFYTRIFKFKNEGKDGPFVVIRVNPDFQILLDPSGAHHPEHYAFAMDCDDFDRIFARIKSEGLPYGPAFDSVGSNKGPGEETGARGLAPTIYLYDPNHHLIEIRCYETMESA